jgi:hypothetical protein
MVCLLKMVIFQAVVTLWRFIHDALDAPLSALGWGNGGTEERFRTGVMGRFNQRNMVI